MAMSEEVEDFKKRVQESLNKQQKKTVNNFKCMMAKVQWAVAHDSFDRDVVLPHPYTMFIKDDEEEASEARSKACVYTTIFTELYLEHTQHLMTDLKEITTRVLEDLSHKVCEIGHRNTKEDEQTLLAVGYIPTADEWKKVTKEVVKVTEFLKNELPKDQVDFASSIRTKFQKDLKRAKIEQLQNGEHPRPMLKRQNGFMGFVYTLEDRPLMMEVTNQAKDDYNVMIRKIQEKSLKRKIKQEPDFVGLPIKKEKIEEKSES